MTHTNEAVRVLREALKAAIDEKCNYMKRNKLGNPEIESVTIMGRKALAATATVAKDGGMTDRHGRMTDAMRDAVTGMSVSIDVSTGEHDSEHRLFGVVNEVMDCDGDKHGVTLLVYDTEANFTPKPEASAEQPAGEVPLGYVDGRPVFVGAKLEQLTRKGWVRHNAQESWRGLSIDWKHDFRWLAVSPLERLDQAAHQIVNACADIQREERSEALAHQSPPSPIGSIGDEIAFIERVDQVASTAVDAHLCGGDFNTAKRNDEAWQSLVAYIDSRAARNAGVAAPEYQAEQQDKNHKARAQLDALKLAAPVGAMTEGGEG